MAKKSKTLYDCILIETPTDSGLTKEQLIESIQQLKDEEILAFDTGTCQSSYEFCAQGFATTKLLEQMDYRIHILLHNIMTRYDHNKIGPQEFNIVTITGDKFSILIC